MTLATNVYFNGTATAQGATENIKQVNFDASGASTQLALGNEVGATWGMTYDNNNKFLYVSEVLRRHVGTKTGGLGGIWKIDMSSGVAAAPVLLMSLPSTGVVARSLSNIGGNDPSADGPAFAEIGKLGIGGIDISADGKTLYAMNLAQSRVDIINVATASVSGSIAFPASPLYCWTFTSLGSENS